MSFDNPFLLYFLSIFAVLVPLVIIRYRKGREGVTLFASAAPSNDRKSLLRELRFRMIFSDVFFLLSTGFLIIALAGPRWGMRIVTDYRRGVDIVLAFDLSRSMNVRDCPPEGNLSRLERGIGLAEETAAALGDIRIAAALGKGRGVLAVPLTYDSDTVLSFLHGLNNQAVSGRGTNLESLLNAASLAFQDSIPSRRVIVLFSDGETLSGSFGAAVEKLRKEGISLCAVALGSDEGGPVPVEKSPEAPDGFLLDEDGLPVISARQVSLLRSGAEKTGSIYIDGNLDNAALTLLNHLNSLSSESRLSGQRRESNPRWRIFVLSAMICLGGARMLGFSRRKKRPDYSADTDAGIFKAEPPATEDRRGGKKGGIMVLLCCLVLLGSCGKTQGKLLVMEGNFFNTRGLYTEAISSYLRAMDYDEAVPYAEFGLGAAYFSLDESAAALERYAAAENGLSASSREGHEELSYRIFYNMGIIYFEKGEYSEAARAFRDALKADGSRIEAKRNLELSLLTVTRSNSPQAASPEGGTEEGRAGGGSGGSSALFRYLRQKEQEQWKSREWTGESGESGPDY